MTRGDAPDRDRRPDDDRRRRATDDRARDDPAARRDSTARGGGRPDGGDGGRPRAGGDGDDPVRTDGGGDDGDGSDPVRTDGGGDEGPGFDVADAAAIRSGRATDAYFLRTEEALRVADRDPTVVAEVTLGQFPAGEHRVFAGVADAARLLAGRPVDVDALPEGRLFEAGPVLRVEGPYLEFARLETALLGFLSEASAMATRALRARRAVPETPVYSFGTRHRHPSVAPVVERAALVGGLDGVSNVAGAERLGREAVGTMPHALMVCFGPGEQEAAWRAFDRAAPEDVPRTALCDTFDDEAAEAVRAAEAVPELDGVRIDTTGSRRGDLGQILREVRWELDRAGHGDVEVFVSGGMTPEAMRAVRDVADGFGVGSYVTDADPLDFGMDVVEVDGDPVAKRGRLPGAKAPYRRPDGSQGIAPRREVPSEGRRMLEPLLRDGEVVRNFDLDAAARRARSDAGTVGFDWRAE